jgi:hypothetical protein
MPISDIDAGRILQKLDTMHMDLTAVKEKTEELGKFQARTDERLAGGARHFEALDARIKAQEARACPKTPKPVTTYWLICSGFGFIGLLMSLFKFYR